MWNHRPGSAPPNPGLDLRAFLLERWLHAVAGAPRVPEMTRASGTASCQVLFVVCFTLPSLVESKPNPNLLLGFSKAVLIFIPPGRYDGFLTANIFEPL